MDLFMCVPSQLYSSLTCDQDQTFTNFHQKQERGVKDDKGDRGRGDDTGDRS